jgi:hypothetical protein
VVDGLAHASGIYYLVKRRGPEQLATRKGFELFFVALIRLVGPTTLTCNLKLTLLYSMHTLCLTTTTLTRNWMG